VFVSVAVAVGVVTFAMLPAQDAQAVADGPATTEKPPSTPKSLSLASRGAALTLANSGERNIVTSISLTIALFVFIRASLGATW